MQPCNQGNQVIMQLCQPCSPSRPTLKLASFNLQLDRQLSAVIGTLFFNPFDQIRVDSTKFDFIFCHPLQVPVLTRFLNHRFPLSPLVSRICAKLRNSCIHAKSPASKAISSWCIVQTSACGSYLRQGWSSLVKVKKEGGYAGRINYSINSSLSTNSPHFHAVALVSRPRHNYIIVAQLFS